MRLIFALPAALALSACGMNALTPRQSVYAAYGSYSAALEGAAAYAESPSANPAIVHRINAANKSAPVVAAVKYGRAFTQCQGSNATVIAGTDCAAFDFSVKTAQGYVVRLRAAITALNAR